MKAARIVFLVVLVVSAVTFNGAQAHEHPTITAHPSTTEHPAKVKSLVSGNDVLAAANKAGNCKTFLTIVQASGLMEKFQGEGPYTVFAPTDEAFAKLPKGSLEDLLKPANKAKLAGLLATHVVPGKIMAAEVKSMKAANVNGQNLEIKVHDGIVTVNDATVVNSDIAASNGVIHAIDTVIFIEGFEHPASSKPKDHPAH